jgi:aspartyl-tRNA(Asn)/glutamyl-tRNA(Gln) amidotransferase subunit B
MKGEFKLVVGLEVHAQLMTQSKLFSEASTNFGQASNSQTTAYCLAHPGTLPVLNARAVEMAVLAGLALNCRVNERSCWSRKHYFYPDLPKGYQITQFEFPICEWGTIELQSRKKIRIRRIHLEEDAGKQIHDALPGQTLVDLNRAGTPLVEIVTEPDFESSREVIEYLKSLREILMAIGVNDGNLEQGSFRCDANVSVMRTGDSQLGTRCEIKNLNSFRSVEAAIRVEAARQIELIESQKTVAQETRLFDVDRQETRSMRSKEDAHDYRYFPEPDLPDLIVSPAFIEQCRNALPELPSARRRRFVEFFHIAAADADTLVNDAPLATFFERAASRFSVAQKVSHWCLGEVSRLLNVHGKGSDEIPVTPEQLVALLQLIDQGAISNTMAKRVFERMFETGQHASEIIASEGLVQVSDESAISSVIADVLKNNEKNVAAFRAGNQKMLGFFVGQVMKHFQGKANPQLINAVLVKQLESWSPGPDG